MRFIVIALTALLGLLCLAQGPDGGLRPPPGDYRVPQPVPPQPQPRSPGPAAGRKESKQSGQQQRKRQQPEKPQKHAGEQARGPAAT